MFVHTGCVALRCVAVPRGNASSVNTLRLYVGRSHMCSQYDLYVGGQHGNTV